MPNAVESSIFISYSREDLTFTERLRKDLTTRKLNVWVDQHDIKTGQQWTIEIEKAIDNCSHFIILLSPSSVSSENVLNELAYALDNEKIIIPVLHIRCKLPFQLRLRQYIDFTKVYDEGLNKLLQSFESNITEFVYDETLVRGWAFPPDFKIRNYQNVMVEAEDEIKQSLIILLGTMVGERARDSEFGCEINRLKFDTPSNSDLKNIEGFIVEAVSKFEPRIELKNIQSHQDKEVKNVINISLDYLIPKLKLEQSIVYQFYYEGASIH